MIVLGLGNPGGNYEKTRHNLGAMAIAEVAARNGASLAPVAEWVPLPAQLYGQTIL